MPADARDGGMVQSNMYLVSSSEGAISRGDVLVLTTIGTARPVTGAFIATSSMGVIGVAAQAVAANAGSTNATAVASSAATLLVYDDPTQVFVACDTTSGIIGSQISQFKNYAILATGCVGSTGASVSGQSNMAISGVTATMAGAFHVIGLHPVEGGVYSTVAAATAASSTEVRKWLGRFVVTLQTQSTNPVTILNTTS